MSSLQKTSIAVFVAFLTIPAAVLAQENELRPILEKAIVEDAPSAMSGYSYVMEFERVKRSVIGRSTLRRKYKALLPTRVPRRKSFRHPMLLVYDNSRKLRPSDIVRERKRIVRRLDEVEKAAESEESEDSSQFAPTDGYVKLRADKKTVGGRALRIDLLLLLKHSTFSDFKRITHGGRSTVVARFKPGPEKSSDPELFYLGEIEGLLFVDEEDKRLVKVEAFPLGEFKKYSSMKPGEREKHRVLHFLQKRMPQGYWFPVHAELNFFEFPYEFERVAVRVTFKFSDYKFFSTGIDSVDIDEAIETKEESIPDGNQP